MTSLPSSLASSPVFALNSDILWRIFLLNTYMTTKFDEDIPALDTLRYTSQVCTAWRELTLQSPSLWGRVINIVLLWHCDEWRDEVIRRTRSSPLYLKVPRTDPAVTYVAVSLANENWSRVYSLDILSFHPKEEKAWTDLLRRPSCLRHLIVRTATAADDFLDSFSISDFPSLETLDLWDSHKVPLDNGDHRQPGTNQHALAIVLPHLQQINIRSFGYIGALLAYLGRISPKEGCTLCFDGVSVVQPDVSPRAVSDILEKFLQCSQKTLAATMEAPVNIQLVRNQIEFSINSFRSIYRIFSFKWSLSILLQESRPSSEFLSLTIS
ncbi:hypothetical protein CPB84DRAFT_1789546 [Gymnopilus junonius]|uniref:F-box domain-containing protein n=1 Tax=Gymnopilus junonius TaxID=109634 RepID=A0A9P5NGS7_GYMJU|nr:hypothetical protein CPB84DRAFT_1789546 [Gymnopilus junonius]